ncbi:Vitamin B12 import ATP-binding protein BtuD [Streptomyces alboniger]
MVVLDEVEMERRSQELLRTLCIRIPSVRIPIASLSGGQRQTVAIARSMLGEPKLVILDEPTTALGVEQTAQVLDLVERLRERGHAVILISHNMADVKAVADKVAVLRLGRNNGVFEVEDDLAGGDHLRHHRCHRKCRDPSCGAHDQHERGGFQVVLDKTSATTQGDVAVDNPDAAAAAVTAVDPRLLVREQGLTGYLGEFKRKMKTGELGSIPVVIGLIVICVVFQSLNSNFLSAQNLSDITVTMVGTGMISVGIVFVLLLGEIDLSVGSVSGAASAIAAVLAVNQGWPEWLAVLVAVAAGAAIGAAHGFFFAVLGAPAFAVTLAGLLFWLGFMLKILGENGTINLDSEGLIGKLTTYFFADVAAAYVLAAVVVAVFFLTSYLGNRRREAVGIPSRPLSDTLARTILLAVVAFAAAYMYNQYKGLPLATVVFLVFLIATDFLLRRTASVARSSRSAAASRRPGAQASTSPRSGSRFSRSPAVSRRSAVCSWRRRSRRPTRAPAPVTC